MDQGLFVTCPYDPNHRVQRLRLQYHIVKCQKSQPNAKLVACPYNATHRITQAEMTEHVKDCPSKDKIFPDNKPPRAIAAIMKPRPIFQRDYLPETDPNHEIWDN